MVVGEADTGDINRGYRGFRWAEDTGMITVEEWLRGQDVAVASDVTRVARATNCDGSVIVGELWDGQMFIARGAGRGDCTSAGIEPDDDPEDAAGIRAEL